MTIRLSVEGLAEIDRLARAEGLVVNDHPNRSEMIRRLLAEAAAARR